MPDACDFNRKETNVETETGKRYGYDVLGSVLEHMAIAYSADGRVNVRFPADMIRAALRAGAVQLMRRNRQRVARRSRKGGAR